ncbi:Tyrosine-sulfated glycopeptide receptor 1 [Striga hermonthica]|uniref:non-specific serine/threonine protein kinase n=1 Tax=Striga hermonthica TaxID=68872 RepID=A0A9N7N0M7_STRHE|nr:Tyrosine-sulfated glycopeptide receptor 1 [Striga hermonthica]
MTNNPLQPPSPPNSPKIHLFSNLLLKTILIIISISILPRTCHGACNPLDRGSLVLFNLTLSSSSTPLAWAPLLDCCEWDGIVCNETGRVTGLWLPSRGLSGKISPSITNLTGLTQLSLSNNRLSGPLPARFFHLLNRLQVIDLSCNSLNGGMAALGALPATLRILNLSSNRFSGAVEPWFFEKAVSLESLDFSNNSFSGGLPSIVCGFSRWIKKLDFSINEFTGTIGPGFGRCAILSSLRAGFNNLSGEVPLEIYRLSSLEELYFPGNRLVGPIDPRVVSLANLKTLALFGNELEGPIPEEIGRLYRLEKLQLHINQLNGTIPASLANCTNLTVLNLRVNLLEGELDFVNFSGFVRLEKVDLGNNFFRGGLPRSLFTCKMLMAVRLATNKLSGEILPEVGSLQFLSFLSISNNSLTNVTNAIRILTRCKRLSTLILSKNFYNESLPVEESLNGFEDMKVLAFGGCNFSGSVPSWIRQLEKLEVIDLSFNLFTGPVPGWFGGLPNLFYLDLSYNLLTGYFPLEMIKMRRLSYVQNLDEVGSTTLELPVFVKPDNASNQQYNQLSNLPPTIYLNNNSITGNIPVEIGQLKFIMDLDLSHNNFTGSIPDTISNLTNLEKLDLSGNNLTGQIPASLKNLHFLSFFSVAHNDLEGPVPIGGQFDTFPVLSFEGNPRLCGRILQRPCTDNSQSGNNMIRSRTEKENRKRTIKLTLVISSVVFTLILLLYLFLYKRKVLRRGGIEEKDMDVISFNSSGVFPEIPKETSLVVLFPNNKSKIQEQDLSVADILKATDNFNQSNIIGCGGFGLVFKATLADGTNLAIKKLSGDMGLMEREFKAEVEALSTAQHKNLVTLQGYCLHDGYRLLIYSYMENGSLDYWLHEKPDGPAQLDWPARLKIARGASCGVAYMHQICEPHIVHRDLKSSNILLDCNFEAHVADFGLARLILPYHTHVTTELVGTLGYIPPEYSQSWIATLRGDMYSFGVVMLELLTGKRPVEMFRPKASRELVVWVQQMKNEGKQVEIFDPPLRGKGFEDEMVQVLDIAIQCVNQNPYKRPTIKEVVEQLESVGPNRQTNVNTEI